ncbi:elongation factor Ts [Candidatus Bipolaricaulota bacterium]|nr:elongation factor Ts [Candidatus Bipolaricaulota bacterium]
MAISTEEVKKLREETGVGIMDCKRALQEKDGDMEEAKQMLREQGMEMSEGKLDSGEGRVGSYIHHDGKVGVLVEVKCQTDFTANSDEFQEFVDNVSVQIAAASPEYVSREDVPEEVVEEEEEVYRRQAKEDGKPDHVIDDIVEGKMDKFYKEICLLEQESVKDTDRTIEEILGELSAKVNEEIEITRFARFDIGADSEEEEE